MRIGHGFDVHAFGNKGSLILAGVSIPNTLQLIAYSDGDVILHALMDALLGATALGDLGSFFSDKKNIAQGISSRTLLKKVWKNIKKKYTIINVDITVIAQKPKIISYIFDMRFNIAQDLNVNINKISLKSTTTDKLGFIGRNEGIACEALVLINTIS